MDDIVAFLLRYSYPLLLAFVFFEQVGLPLPALPVLLAAGALIRTGQLDPSLALVLCVVGSLVADLLWYEIGRRRGGRVLQLLCRISLEPDSCVRRTEETFARHGVRSLAIAKFVPGLNTAAPPLAGMFGMHLGRFVLWDAVGAILWSGALLGLGYAFGEQLEELAAAARTLGAWVVVVLGAPLVGYLGVKLTQRRRFLRRLRIARIRPEELKARLDAGEDVVTVDLRHALDFENDPESIPGALHLPAEQVEARQRELPTDRDLILLCT